MQTGGEQAKKPMSAAELRRKRVSVVIGVVGCMAFVVAVWALVLPNQIFRAKEGSGPGLTSWSLMRVGDDVKNVRQGWQSGMEEVNDLLDTLMRDEQPEKSKAPLSAEAIEGLKQQIEAAAAAAPDQKKK